MNPNHLMFCPCWSSYTQIGSFFFFLSQINFLEAETLQQKIIIKGLLNLELQRLDESRLEIEI